MNYNDLSNSREKFNWAKQHISFLRDERQWALEQAEKEKGHNGPQEYLNDYPDAGEWMCLLMEIDPPVSCNLPAKSREKESQREIRLRCALCFDLMCSGDSDEDALKRVNSLLAMFRATQSKTRAKGTASSYALTKVCEQVDLQYLALRRESDAVEARLLPPLSPLLPHLVQLPLDVRSQIHKIFSFITRIAEGNSVDEDLYRLVYKKEPYQLLHKDGNTRTVQPPSYYTLDEETKNVLGAIFH